MEGLLEAAEQQLQLWGDRLEESSANVPLLTALGEVEERQQMGNPVRVVTSGVERIAPQAFWAKGKWRMCVRARWWNEYHDPVPVIIGHYWRLANADQPSKRFEDAPEMFDLAGATEWVGAKRNVFCVDYSAGMRYHERRNQVTLCESHLAALRWPEQELWFETGIVGSARMPRAMEQHTAAAH